ncbi:hypothetical protein [Marinobacter subterrani]|uniref:Uncharacterized protein n=1 Tax=Marinobacter subterrani TaxID=1658765 RepID=A0A0J7M2N0_9GAMM|nr:hypothetical protein [Marinobacter subterrani]KMQ75270.1 hypothetical protein Msub_11471 [Marinobacter subterrani]
MATLTIELPEQVTQGQMMQALESIGCELRLARDGRNYTAVPKERAVRRSSLSQMKRQSTIFRKQYDKVDSGGYVIFFKGKAVAWWRWLDHPSGWEPGCIALDDTGKQWVATGGNAYEGAMRWEVLVGETQSNVARMPTRIREIPQPGPGAA